MNKVRRPVEIYVDGSLVDKEFGAYGVLMMFGQKSKEIKSKSYKGTSIARMELKAVIRALEELKPGFQIYIYSDSKNTVDIINNSLSEWVELGALDKSPSAGLWRRFLQVKRRHIEGGSLISFCWIRGHSGNKFNDTVDAIAKNGLRGKKIKCEDNN